MFCFDTGLQANANHLAIQLVETGLRDCRDPEDEDLSVGTTDLGRRCIMQREWHLGTIR